MSETLHKIITAERIANLVEEQVAILASTLRPDYRFALEAALAHEQSERGREVLEQLLANARIAREEGLPLCQDTGYVWICLEVNVSDAKRAASQTATSSAISTKPPIAIPTDVFSGVDAAVERAAESSGMRMSMLSDALIDRTNTNNNAPAFCEIMLKQVGPEDEANAPLATLHIMLKGGGSDNASAVGMLPPGEGVDGVLAFVTERVLAKGANACPPLVVGVGVGSSFDKVGGLAKHALLREIGSVHPNSEIAELEAKLLSQINASGIGPGGLGGSATALAVHIESAPCHIAALPVAVNIGCTALRSVSIPLG